VIFVFVLFWGAFFNELSFQSVAGMYVAVRMVDGYGVAEAGAPSFGPVRARAPLSRASAQGARLTTKL
jgi:hypothetical protein